MSSTRKASLGSPLAQERYMSSVEMAEKDGLKGMPVAAKAALYSDPRKRSLLFFLQAMSTRPGGLEKVAEDLVEMFPERPKPASKHSHCPTCESERLEQLWNRSGASEEHDSVVSVMLSGFLWEYCLNPRVAIVLPGESHRGCVYGSGDSQSLPSHWSTKTASLCYFRDITGALLEYKARHEQQARESIAETAISKSVFRTLARGLRSRKIVVVQGVEGIGKSFGGEAWRECHLGEAVFVRLEGIVTKTTFFQVVSKALGLAGSVSQKSQEMQIRIRHHLERSGLMLVIDEAHRLFQPSERIYSHPELLNWIYTLWDFKIPVALLVTPQFVSRMDEVERQTDWRSGQLKRRIELWTQLPEKLSEDDLRTIARNVAPHYKANMIDELVDFALPSRRQVDAMRRAMSAAEFIAEEKGRKAPTFQDLLAGIEEAQLTDQAMTTPLDKKRQLSGNAAAGKARRRRSLAEPLHDDCSAGELPQESQVEEPFSRATTPSPATRLRDREPALV
jgi:hypothetical protein